MGDGVALVVAAVAVCIARPKRREGVKLADLFSGSRTDSS